MNQLLNQLQTEDFSLLVSLPRNDVELAQAALEGGAQGLKVHLNVEHFASGTRFGSFAEERENLARIVQVAGSVPIGVVPGGSPFATEEEFAALAELGIDFFDAYPADAPAWALTQPHLDVMLAAFAGSSLEMIMALDNCGMQMCEASIMAHEEYGRDMNALDLARYGELVQLLEAPVIVPTQKHVRPADVRPLRQVGIRGLLIGAIVTGRDAQSIREATRTFRDAIDRDVQDVAEEDDN